jgi:predicted negative regulator of RcsB-dependent stress response
MAVYDLEEQEKIDALKAWWKEWGNTVIAAVIVFVATLAGVNVWRHFQVTHTTEASTLYDELKKEKDVKKVSAGVQALLDQYSDTPYAGRAALVAAKRQFEAGDLAAARASLEWVAQKAQESEIQDVARLRLASVLGDQKKFDEALRVLEGIKQESFSGPALVLKGDLLVAQGKPAEARAAYLAALDKASPTTDKQSLEMKLDMLGEAK